MASTHFLSTLDWSRAELEAMLEDARQLKSTRKISARIGKDDLAGRSIALVFFNPSLRTRSSFEIGVFEMVSARAVCKACRLHTSPPWA